MDKKEWLQEIDGHTKGPWIYEETANKKTVINFLWYVFRCWVKTIGKGNTRKYGIITGIDEKNGERVIVAILGNGPTSRQNGMLICGAPVLLKENKE